jgi:hypothetical protein
VPVVGDPLEAIFFDALRGLASSRTLQIDPICLLCPHSKAKIPPNHAHEEVGVWMERFVPHPPPRLCPVCTGRESDPRSDSPPVFGVRGGCPIPDTPDSPHHRERAVDRDPSRAEELLPSLFGAEASASTSQLCRGRFPAIGGLCRPRVRCRLCSMFLMCPLHGC